MTKDQKEKLKKIIDRVPRSYGYDTDLWTLKRISEVISREFDVSYNTTHIWRVLKNLGYSAQILVAVAMEKNPEYVKEWLEKKYPEYVKEAKEKNATILFQDEPGVQSRPNVRRTWSPRGRRLAIRVREKRDRISISSAISAAENRMGRFLPMYNGEYTPLECFSIYRDRDRIEKAFRIIKTDLDIFPMRVRKESITRGMMFIFFLSLIIRTVLMRGMMSSGLMHRYSLEKMLL